MTQLTATEAMTSFAEETVTILSMAEMEMMLSLVKRAPTSSTAVQGTTCYVVERGEMTPWRERQEMTGCMVDPEKTDYKEGLDQM